MRSITLLLGILLIIGCAKKEDSPTPSPGNPGPADPVTTLPGRVWVLSGQTATTSSGTVNEYTSLLGCDRDNTYTFTPTTTGATSGSYQYREGATSCDAGTNTLIHNGTYRLNSAKDSVITVQAGFSITTGYKIQSITTRELKLQFTGQAGGQATTYLYTYTAN
jgi:hypothetical protein